MSVPSAFGSHPRVSVFLVARVTQRGAGGWDRRETRRGSTSAGHRSSVRASGAHITPFSSSDLEGVGGYASPKLGDAKGVEEEKVESKMTLKNMDKLGLVTRSSVF